MRNLFLIFSMLGILCISGYTVPKTNNTVKGKIYFSNQPFTTSNTGSKKTFTSADYIYGRMELDDETIDKAFKVSEIQGTNPDGYLLYRVYIYYKGEEEGFNSTGNFCLIRAKEKNSKVFNFDVLADPSKLTTIMGGTTRFDYSTLGTTPLYGLMRPEIFEENGEYKIVVKMYAETKDAWGNLEPVENWPVLQEEFTFNFNSKDVKTILKNNDVAEEKIKASGFRKIRQ
jgi:hypothetical protein